MPSISERKNRTNRTNKAFTDSIAANNIISGYGISILHQCKTESI